MFSQTTAAVVSEPTNRQLMEACGVGNAQATAIAAAIEALNTNYMLDDSDARRVPTLIGKGLTATAIAATFTVSIALPTWSFPPDTWPFP